MKQGTEWTKPGQGARVMELRLKIQESKQFSHSYVNGDPVAAKAYTLLVMRPYDTNTNLRLTGSPLTAEDLARIAECK